ncbi:hypothetical protein LSUB1_G006968 [Lachnellula subtilissima]|uniref:Tyrosine specific protein phosphatases domain-containing protein n=1 Tax=Lachnellula subtilissima TaxID=602034 RepID=A0A8H8RFG9_9HELO|nr:hypothetical protein LSUB1_G006968 [Lachnellula subtilissima]
MAEDNSNKKTDIQTAELSPGQFENILNFRDVGKTINGILGEKRMIEGKLFRSARPDDATFSDRERLRDEYGIKTIIDLRTVTEHANQAKKREGDLQIPALVKSNAALAEPLKIPGIKYLEININGKGFERSLLWKLSYWSFTKLIVLMIFGYRMQAISILGREVMQPRGLVGLGFDSIDYCGPEIADALREFSNPASAPILTHCTQGKDRTGLLIALILFLIKVPIPAITHDYILSETELFPERESRLVEIRSIGLTEDFAGCPKEWIEEIEKHLEEKYGGVRQYCRGIGFMEVDEERLISGLIGRTI